MADRFAEIGTVHQIAEDEIVLREAFIFEKRPPVDLVEAGLLQRRELSVILYQLLECVLRLRRESPPPGRGNTPVLHQPILELMLLKRDLEIAAKRPDPFVTLAYPLRPELANKAGSLRKRIREDPPADPAPRFEDRHVPARIF